MIALNELIKNSSLFESRYALKGVRQNLTKIFVLEEKRKKLQLKTEKMRAECNKLCGKIADLRNAKDNLSNKIKEITYLDKQILKNNKTLERQNIKINAELKKLHNLPDATNERNIQYATENKKSTIEDLQKFLNTCCDCDTEEFDKNIKNKLVDLKNFILDKIPIIYKCANGFLILSSKEEFEKIKLEIINYFKKNSINLIEKSCKMIQKHCSAEIVAKINNSQEINIEIVREFMTRDYRIKYHNSNVDMTNFANQINIILNKSKL